MQIFVKVLPNFSTTASSFLWLSVTSVILLLARQSSSRDDKGGNISSGGWENAFVMEMRKIVMVGNG